VSLGLDQGLSFGALAPEPPHKSAGTAFLLSLLLPGSGQLYCGKRPRGFTTLGFWSIGVLATFGSSPARGNGIVVAFVLWVFAFLDAYFTATEINSGIDPQVEVQNPRVAVVLNLLTAGLGYFYLGERAKGIVLFLVINVLKVMTAATSGYWYGVVSIISLMVAGLMAVDAYRIAKRGISEALGPEAERPTAENSGSRLPVYVPIGLASLATAGVLAIVVFGLAVIAARGPNQRSVAAKTTNPFGRYRAQSRYLGTRSKTASDDLLSVVENVQRLERKADRSRRDMAVLERNIATLTTLVGKGDLNTADLTVAYFYRAEARRVVNEIHERGGESTDLSSARLALEDFDKVISNGANVYVPEVNTRNAQYWAGSVAMNQLHSQALAYSYWEKCAAQGNVDCVNILTAVRLAGMQNTGRPAATGTAH
jgi:TM2 domain-containing membrane protein YozV